MSHCMREIKKRTKPHFITIVGLGLSLVAPVFYSLIIGEFFFSDQAHSLLGIYIGLFFMWFLSAAVVLLTHRGEKRPLSSIGWKLPTVKLIILTLGLGVLLSLAVPALSILAGMIITVDESGSIQTASQIPWLLMLSSVITAGITEELLFRGYALERLLEWTGSKWISSIVSLVCFTAIHIAEWNMVHIIGVVIPMGVALIVLYWWKRNLLLVIIAHITIFFPLVFFSVNECS